ncbi:hypothetical protein PRIPAC_92196 [Pristionchus pacificus]|uniref:Uncharacterized protein n=1 Tax=Pristionchus pacificus TaxID=54126 RepID=A0A2A6BQD7_PRIPA|nr:hypothetical protein PRIPAC_92196 [Pristionchus pacificus]|eukprot:PDM68129.1 hypothetical protein PRIPAC_46173 [Pristionchus pacificus]
MRAVSRRRAVARISSTVRGGRHALSQVPGLSFRGRRPQARNGCAVPGRLAESYTKFSLSSIAVDDPTTECATARLTLWRSMDGRASSTTSSERGNDKGTVCWPEVGLLSKMTSSMDTLQALTSSTYGSPSLHFTRSLVTRTEVSPNLFILTVLISLRSSMDRPRPSLRVRLPAIRLAVSLTQGQAGWATASRRLGSRCDCPEGALPSHLSSAPSKRISFPHLTSTRLITRRPVTILLPSPHHPLEDAFSSMMFACFFVTAVVIVVVIGAVVVDIFHRTSTCSCDACGVVYSAWMR